MNTNRSFLAAALLTLSVSLPGPVRAAAPAGQYVISGGGAGTTVYDTKSKLTWTRASRLGTWAEAKATCAALGSTVGGTGWRLPTFKELVTLLDLSQTSGDKIDPAFPSFGSLSGGHWSMTQDANDPGRAWNLNFFYGDSYPYLITYQNAYKCVR